MEMPTKEEAQARFWELKALVDAGKENLAPLREELNSLVAGDTDLTVAAAHAREADLRAAIEAAQESIFPDEQEMAVCARFLGGSVGEDPNAVPQDA